MRCRNVCVFRYFKTKVAEFKEFKQKATLEHCQVLSAKNDVTVLKEIYPLHNTQFFDISINSLKIKLNYFLYMTSHYFGFISFELLLLLS